MMILICVLAYFLPAMVAIYRRHLNATAIFMTDFLLGWTVIGWIVALIWAFTNNPSPVAAQGVTARPASKFLKFIFVLVFTFVLLVAWILATHKISGHKGMMQETTPAIKTGVPIPADELFGK